MTTKFKLQMPKGGLTGADGKLTAPGQHYLAEVGDRLSNAPAGDASTLLLGGDALVAAQALWDTMVSDVSSGAGHWSPNIGAKLDFVRTVTGVTVIDYPSNVPEAASLFYSAMIKMDGVGGWAVTMGEGFEGEAPSLLTDAFDKTLVGFKVTGPATWTAWAIKGIEFTA